MAPTADASTIQLDPGASYDVGLNWTGAGLAEGAYSGFVTITSANTGKTSRVPYWFDSTSGTPAGVTMLYNPGTAPRRGRTSVYFRVLDKAGMVLTNADPVVSSVSGGGTAGIVANYDSSWPGGYAVSVRLNLNPGDNVFRITAGDLTYNFPVTGY